MAMAMQPVPQTVDQNQKLVGARVPPHWASRLLYPPCAISGYEHGDPTKGIFEGKALLALILEFLCLGCIVSLCCWSPDPEKIKGDGTQRTVENKCLAGFCTGFAAIAFWETGDFICTPDGQCTWCSEGTLPGCAMHFLPGAVGLPPLDCCYVCCCWQPNHRNFKRSTFNHGGGAQGMVGMPVQASGPYIELWRVQAEAGMVPQVMGAVQAQPVVAQAVVVGAQPTAPGGGYQPQGYEMPQGNSGNYGSPPGTYGAK